MTWLASVWRVLGSVIIALVQGWLLYQCLRYLNSVNVLYLYKKVASLMYVCVIIPSSSLPASFYHFIFTWKAIIGTAASVVVDANTPTLIVLQCSIISVLLCSSQVVHIIIVSLSALDIFRKEVKIFRWVLQHQNHRSNSAQSTELMCASVCVVAWEIGNVSD